MNASAGHADTIAINHRMTQFEGHSQVWLLGYGSLIYKVTKGTEAIYPS